MTISDLIARLQTYPSDSEVEFSDEDGEVPIDDVEEEGGIVYLCSGDEEDEINEEDEETENE